MRKIKNYITFRVEHEYDNLEQLEEEVRKYLFEDNDDPLPSKISVVAICENKDMITVPKRDWNDLSAKKKKAMKVETSLPIEVEEKEPPHNPFRETLECPNCGKKCNSKSGLTLHKKNCN